MDSCALPVPFVGMVILYAFATLLIVVTVFYSYHIAKALYDDWRRYANSRR